jgi:alpha-mannosidase
VIEDRKTIRTMIERVIKDVVRPAVYPRTIPLRVSAHHVRGEPITVGEAFGRAFDPFEIGGAWGGRWDTTWFRFEGAVPDDWAGEDVVARIDIGGGGVAPSFTAEGQLWRADDPVQGLHHLQRDHRIAAPAKGGEPVELYVEAAANPIPPFHSTEWPLLQADPHGAPLYVLTRAELAVVDREVEALWFDLRALLQLVDAVDAQPRNNQVLRSLHDAVKALDRADVAGTAKAARSALEPALARRSTLDHVVTAVGHAHIDTAWLWPVRETKRKVARTFSNQLSLMDDYPEHRFVASQAQQYAWVRDEYPALWQRVKAAVAGGRWEPVGGMWVEPDTNVPSGESLVRQLVLGQRFFIDELGHECTQLWIPDVFGYSAALPQIARQAGITALITQKLSWNTTNRFPHSTFWWEGSDGSRLLTHFPPANTYNGIFSVAELAGSVGTFADHGRSDRSLYPFGFGDGGGGPSRDMLEMHRRIGDLEGLPKVDIGRVDELLDAIHANDGDALETWVGELYLEFHRGTYTTQAATKKGNRLGEQRLREAELWSAAVCARSGDWSTYPTAALQRAWELLLLNQFHDIIPGSSINWVYEDAARDHDEVISTCETLIARAQEALGGRVFNSASQPQHGVPACGWSPTSTPPEAAPSLENDHLRVRWDEDGLITSIWDKDHDREVLSGRGNVFTLHEDHPNEYDAWDIDSTFEDRVVELLDAHAVEITGSELRVERRFGTSTITQTISLHGRRLDFDTEVDWHEHHKLLKVAFPVAVRSSRATYEIQHGQIERPTVRNTSWDAAMYEVCAQRWADLSETGYGVALLNDCKYGHDIRGDVMRLSLLRAPGWPDPQADRGRHSFRYALLPHAGDVLEGDVVAEAEAFNLPLVVRDAGGADTASFVSVDRRGVSIEAVKKADREEALVVRVCEVAGRRGPVTITVDAPGLTSAARTDLLERDTGALELAAGGSVTLRLGPFELATVIFR